MSDDWDNATCHSVGVNGGCGIDCPVLNRWECPISDEVIDTLKEQGQTEELLDYGLIEEEVIDPFDLFDDAMGVVK